jgi:hypothetical protein
MPEGELLTGDKLGLDGADSMTPSARCMQGEGARECLLKAKADDYSICMYQSVGIGSKDQLWYLMKGEGSGGLVKLLVAAQQQS